MIDTIELVIQALRTARTAGAMEALAALDEDGLSPDPDQVNFLAARLHTAVRDELQDAVSRLPADLMSVRIVPHLAADADGPLAVLDVVATSPRQADSAVTVATRIVVPPEPTTSWSLQVVTEDADHRAMIAPMSARIGNLYPALTTVTRQRIQQWARQLVNTLAAELARQGRPA